MGFVKIIHCINSFIYNSSIIKVKWEILNDLKMDHMPETELKGWIYISEIKINGNI